MEILRKAGGNVVNGSFSLEETFIIHFKSSAMKSLTRKNFRQVQPLGGFLFPILLFLKKDVTFWKSFLFHKMAWILFSQLSLKLMHLTAFSRSFLVGWKKCSSRTICVDFFAKVDLLSFSGWVFSKMGKEKNSSTIDLFFSIEIKSEPGFRFVRREKSVKGWVYVFLLCDLV